MQFSESWLRQYVNPPLDSADLAHAMTMAGLEVEERYAVAPPFTQVVVAEILSTEQHPDADRLRVCKVNAGTGEDLTIVCGAPNARAGIKIPCALVGASLPAAEVGGKPLLIKVGKLRGVESQGMLCSGRELGLGDDHAGIYELPADAPIGEDIRQYLHLDEQIFVVKLTPNKADCLSLIGMAREVAAITKTPLQLSPVQAPAVSIPDQLKVNIVASDLCGRFAGRIIRGVNASAPTPAWLVQRLKSAGQRSISPLVDISNYVMLEMGQPSHVFDLDRLVGDLSVRWAKPGESIELLNGQTLVPISDEIEPTAQITSGVGVVADEKGLVSLAGLMGGNHSAVTDKTTNIYVEAAFWWPAAIQGRSRRLNFTTDAGHRFERGVDPQATVDCLAYLSALIIEVCGGRAGPIDDQIVALPERKPVSMRLKRAMQIIGIPLTVEVVSDVFTRLGFEFTSTGSAAETIFQVMPPSYRFDLEIEEDLIEEVARLYGFEHIPDLPPRGLLAMRATPEKLQSIHLLRHRFAQQGYQEVVNFGFTEPEFEQQLANGAPVSCPPINVLNPIAAQYAVMRSTLLGGLLANLRSNLNRGASRMRLFEVGRTFTRVNSLDTLRLPNSDDAVAAAVAGIWQPLQIAGLAYGFAWPEQWGVANKIVDFFDIKGDLETILMPLHITTSAAPHAALHPGRCAAIQLSLPTGARTIGWIGELHPALQQKLALPLAPIVFEFEWDAISLIDLPSPNELSKLPAVQRDLAIVVKQNFPAQLALDAMLAKPPAFVQKITLFDEFRSKADSTGSASNSGLAADEKSLAFRITLLNPAETLQDEQVDAVIATLLAQLEKKCGARLR
ncbi:phenylalanine--tRNA ligase subunit beta [Polynucleobacter sp. IMCC30063]|uniref:phenylalanine--tRNA ligase subunit beta n=1 Tax=Polynucleobacter sp. IMCC30063 TaxID=2907298 RepID=UPI001F328119|nr:phenylalanine--tRNA ligase subunit beta [Polynucleobacter sp. IMCC30063]MCE7506179.1 phenylalanine--tRNA ligase subunit beta [Polynucleobacter sp. IMCC30063]